MKTLDRAVESFSEQHYDVIIVGGGVYGLMLTLEAARRNLRVLLLEEKDFIGQTSQNHLRTVHGGIRYLQAADFSRFWDSVGERKWFLQYFPEHTRAMPCLMPLYNKKLHRKSIMWAALLLNDVLSAHRNRGVSRERHLPAGKILSRPSTIKAFAGVQTDGLKGGAAWYDGSLVEFQRLFSRLLRLAVSLGAGGLNYMKATGLLTADGRVAGVRARDMESGREKEFRAGKVINAAGPWVREVAALFDRDYPELFLKRLLLWNVLFDRQALSDFALGLSTKKGGGHTYFFHPWQNRLLVGTGEKIVEKSTTETRVTDGDMAAFIQDINRLVPGLSLKESDILRVYSGILPANAQGKLAARPAFIDHGKNGGPKGLFSVSGVKFTTARLVADRTLKKVFPGSCPRPYKEILAGHPGPGENCFFDYDWRPKDDRDMEKLRRIVAEEAVIHLGDLVIRRTSLGDNPKRALAILPQLKKLFAWPEAKWQAEVETLKRELGRETV